MPDRMRELVDRINAASQAYYVYDKPMMSDAQWDELYNELLRLEAETGERLPDSPSRRVGGDPLPYFEEHRHLHRLYSMDKAQTEEELNAWFDRAEKLRLAGGFEKPLRYCVEYKFDGLTINLTYQGGQLVQAATRGNGIVGESILPQAKTIESVPLTIPYPGLLEVQGECLMRLSVLEKYNKTAAEPLKNARNGAAGALRNLDPAVTRARKLSVFFYEINTIENAPYHDQQEKLAFLKQNGFPISPLSLPCDSREEAISAVRAIEKERETLDFLIDGAVIKLRDEEIRASFGCTDKFPRWAVAFKFAAEENTATLEKVTWELGRTGKLTPLGHVSAVDFAGVTVRKATLNNFGDIQRKNLALGRTVWIRRSNDVIPEIMGCVDDGVEGTPIEKPSVCPSCGHELIERGAHLFCMNRVSCKPQAVARLAHYASRDAMDIDTFSEKTAELFYDRLNVRDPADLYGLTAPELLGLDGFKEKRVLNLLDALGKSKTCTLDAFLYAIGIPNIGKRTARDLAGAFGTIEKVMSATADELTAIDEIGEIVAQSVTEFFSFPENREMVKRLLEAGVSPAPVEKTSGGPFQNLSIVVTGTLPTLSRAQAEELIARMGGKPASAVSKKTAFVVAGESAGSKLQKAEALGIEVIDESEFLRRAGE